MRVIAAACCVGLIGYLFWRDVRKPDRDSISWVPFVWMFIAGSRFVSRWLNLQAPADVVDAYAEGSPIDRSVFLVLIIWGAIVLARRNISWGRLLASNKWLAAYILYCLVSMAWSNEPVIVGKRWVKDLGNPIVALVMLTETKPYEAIVVTLRRLAFAWLPLSILFIRYYPEFGRTYTSTGAVTFSGVADQKNTLGLSCLLVGVGCAWRILLKRESVDRYDLLIGGLLAWLLYLSNSKTSLACLVIAIAILAYAARPASSKRPTRLMTVAVASVVLYMAGDAMFDLRNYVLNVLNRDPTLTNRTDVWDYLLSLGSNPIVGTGFMSFWTGDRMRSVWKEFGTPINQAHSGYLEQYLNLGYIGLGFLCAITFSALASVRRQLNVDYASGVLRFCILVLALLYNYTEASFYGTNNMWVLFLAASIDPPAIAAPVSNHIPAVVRSMSYRRVRMASASRVRRVRDPRRGTRQLTLRKMPAKKLN
jgi:exopolysaccharide production protein ExoQ